MKMIRVLSLLLFQVFFVAGAVIAQVLIHSHNDYVHTRPFYDAYQAAAYSIEADIYVRENKLLVAHAADEIKPGSTLEKLYLEPLAKICVLKMRQRSAALKTLPVMLVDFKEDQDKIMPVFLEKLRDMQKKIKAQGVDTMPLFVVTGNRPPSDSFALYPSYIQFDGRPYEQYTQAAMGKVAFISDQYLKYSTWNGKDAISPADSATLVKLIQTVHEKGKMLRLWNTPDTELGWKAFKEMGIDLINTDQPLICRKFFAGS